MNECFQHYKIQVRNETAECWEQN